MPTGEERRFAEDEAPDVVVFDIQQASGVPALISARNHDAWITSESVADLRDWM